MLGSYGKMFTKSVETAFSANTCENKVIGKRSNICFIRHNYVNYQIDLLVLAFFLYVQEKSSMFIILKNIFLNMLL